MKVIIIHGIMGHAGIHWQQWLFNQLQEDGCSVQMPQMPDADHPIRQVWLETVQQLMQDNRQEETVLVGHSLGVVTALDYIEQSTKKVRGLVSVAGFAEAYGAELNEYFMKEKAIDFTKINNRLGNAYVMYGDNDPYVPQNTLRRMSEQLHVAPKIYPLGGHLNTDSGFTKFPDVLAAIKQMR